jgi:hypothetical protein
MARAVITSDPERRAANEPLYDKDPQSGATIEIFYADLALARSFGAFCGWFWWACLPGCLPDAEPHGPFPTSYRAYRDAVVTRTKPAPFGRRIT